MSKKIEVQIGASLDEKQAQANIESQLQRIGKNTKFKVQDVDLTRVVSRIQSQMSSLSDSISRSVKTMVSESTKNMARQAVEDIAKVQSSLTKTLAPLQASISNIGNQYGKRGLSGLTKEYDQLSSRIANLTNVQKNQIAVEKSSIEQSIALLKSKIATTEALRKTSVQASKDQSAAAAKTASDLLKTQNTLTKTLAPLQTSIAGTKATYGNTGIRSLTREYDQLLSRIQNLGSVEASQRAVEAASIEQSIALLKSKIATTAELGRVSQTQAAAAQKANEKQAAASEKSAEAALKAQTALTKALAPLQTSITKTQGKYGDQSVVELQQQYNALMTSIQNLNTLSGTQLVQERERIAQNIALLKQQIGVTNEKAAVTVAESERERQAYEAVQQQLRQIYQYSNSNGRLAGTGFGGQLQALMAELRSGNVSPERLDQIATEFNNIKAAASAAGVSGQSFFTALKGGIAQIAGLASLTQVFRKVVSEIKQMYEAVRQVDAAMVEFRKVTSLTESQYAQFYERANTLRREVGAGLADTINSTSDFVKLGFGIDDAESLASAALIYKNIGSGITSIDEATTSLVSTVKAFDSEASDAISIVDKFNIVGNQLSITSSGIGDAMQRSASALSAAGNTIDESIALIAAANSTVQNPEVVGTAMKTLTMYLRAAKTEAESAGIETDGMAESVSKLRKSISELTGVDIMIDENTFKSTYQIIKEISVVWNRLSDASQSNVLALLGGKRGANTISSLITNFQDAEKAMRIMASSSGSAFAENEKYLDGIQGRLNQLQGSFEVLSMDFLGSDLVRSGVTFVDGLVRALDGLTKAFGPVTVAFAGISLAIDMFSKNSVKSFAYVGGELYAFGNKVTSLSSLVQSTMSGIFTGPNGIWTNAKNFAQALRMPSLSADQAALTNYVNALRQGMSQTDAFNAHMLGASDGAKAMAMGVTNAATASQTLGFNVEAASIKMRLLQIATQGLNMAANMLIRALPMLALTLITKLITGITDSIRKQREEEEQRRQQAIKTAQDTVESVRSAVKEYDALREAQEKGTLSQSDFNTQAADVIKTLLRQKETIHDLILEYGGLEDALFNVSMRRIDENIPALQEAVTQATKENISKGRYYQLGPLVDDDFEELLSADELASIISDVLNSYARSSDIIGGEINDALYDMWIGVHDETIEGARSTSALIADIFSTLTERLNPEQYRAFTNSDIYDALYSEKIRLDNIVSQYDDSLSDLNQELAEYAVLGYRASNELPKSAEEFEIAKQAITNALSLDPRFAMNYSGESSALEAAKSVVEAYLLNMDWAAEYLLKSAKTVDGASSETEKTFNGFEKSVKRLMDGMELLRKARAEMNDPDGNGGISMETLQAMAAAMDEGEDLSQYLIYENGIIKQNEDAWRARSAAMVDSDVDILSDKIHELEAMESLTEEEQTKLDNLRNLREIYQEVGKERYNDYIINDVQGSVDAIKEAADNVKVYTDALDGMVDGTAMSTQALNAMWSEHSYAAVKAANQLGLSFEEIDGSYENQVAWLNQMEENSRGAYDKLIDSQIRELKYAMDLKLVTDEQREVYAGLIEMLELYRTQIELWNDETKKAVELAQKLSDTTSTYQNVDSFIAGVRHGGYNELETFMDFLSLAQDLKVQDLGSLISFDGSNVEYNLSNIDKYAEGLLDTLDEIEGAHPELKGLKEYVEDVIEAQRQMDDLTSSLTKYQDATSLLEQARSEMTGTQGLSLETIQSIMSTVDNWSEYLYTEGDAVKLNTEAWQEYAQSLDNSADMIADLEAQAESDRWVINWYRDNGYGENAFATQRLAATEAQIAVIKAMYASVKTEAQETKKSLDDMYSETGDVVSGLLSLNRETEITYDEIQKLIEIDAEYAYAVEYQNGILTLNAEKYDEVTQKVIERTRAEAEAAARALKTGDRYIWLTQHIDKLKDHERQELAGIEAEIMSYRVLASELSNATNAYNKFTSASSESTSTRYGAAQDAFDVIKGTLYDSKSELYGKVGRDQFTAAVEFLIDPEIDINSDAFKDAWAKVKRYITEDGKGAEAFYNDLIENGFIDANGVLDASLDDMASKLGISTELARTMLDELNTYFRSDILVGLKDGDEWIGDAATDAEESKSAFTQAAEELAGVSEEAGTSSENLTTMAGSMENVVEKALALTEALGPEGVLGALRQYSQAMYPTGNVDLFNRQILSGADMFNAGWVDDFADYMDDVVTLYTNTFTAGAKEVADFEWAQNVVIDLTPITQDGQILSPEGLEDYVAGLFENSGSIDEIMANDTLGLVMRVDPVIETDGKTLNEAFEKALEKDSWWAKAVHSLSASITAEQSGISELGGSMAGYIKQCFDDAYEGAEQEVLFLAQALVDGLNGVDTAQQQVTALTQSIEALNPADISLNASSFTRTARSVISSLNDIIERLKTIQKNSNISLNISGSGSSNILGSLWGRLTGNASAGGTSSSHGGRTLVGELGREIVVDPENGTWWTVGNRGPELVNLPKNAIVLNAAQTSRILGKAGFESGDSMASGRITAETLATNRTRSTTNATNDATNATNKFADIISKATKAVSDWVNGAGLNEKPNFNTGGSSSGSTKSGSSGSGGGSSSSSSSEEDNWFVIQYRDHNHLVNMNQELVKDYLEWLDDAYKRAYDERLFEIDEYYKYQEEVYEGLHNLFKDYLNDIEHEIAMRENVEGETNKIIDLYEEMISSVEEEIKKAREQGLDDTDDYVQELQDKWFSYQDAITKLEDTISKNAEDSVDELVKIRQNMLKQSISDEKDAIKERLKQLKDFYQKQKDMLKDVYDEEKYLEEQSEKRKTISDLQAELAQLEYDNSAWAQKRRLQLQEELADAQKELDDFERDHAIEVAQEQLDKLYEIQEEELNAQTEALEKQEKDSKALYEQALEDIRNGSVELYNEMIEWNDVYGDGIQDTITTAWESAYKALEDYRGLYGELYKDIALYNATGWSPSGESWDTHVISGTNPANKSAPRGGTTESAASSASYPYGKASATSGTIKNGSRGDNVKALQYALNQLGYGNSGTTSLDGIFGSGTESALKAFQKAMGAAATGVVDDLTRELFGQKGYGTGTRNASRGWHRIDEHGSEMIFESANGSRYRLFGGGEHVLDAQASEFLYNFATSGGSVVSQIIGGVMKAVRPSLNAGIGHDIHMGDIIINGNADQRTVSEIRRAQRESVDFMLKEFSRLGR